MARNPDDEYSKEETERRLVAALRGAKLVGHKDRSEMKIGKSRAKKAKSPGTQKGEKRK